MIKLLCVGKVAVWDYITKQCEYRVVFTPTIAGTKFEMPMDVSNYDTFQAGVWYEFIASEFVDPSDDA